MQLDRHLLSQVDPLIKPHKNLQVYDMLVQLVEAEERSTNQIRASEEEVIVLKFLFSRRYSLGVSVVSYR